MTVRKPLRVLINGVHARSGGGVTYLRNILPLLAKEPDLEVHLFLHVDQYATFAPVEDGIRLHLFNFGPGLLRLLAWEQSHLPILARAMGAEITFSPANYGPLLAPRPIIQLSNSLAVVGHETRLLKRLYWIGLALMTLLSLLTCRRAIAVSHHARHSLTFGLSPLLPEISTVYHGVDEAFSPGHSTARKPFLLTVSDIYVQKNLHALVEAMAHLRKKLPHVRLKIAGRPVDSQYSMEITKTVEKHGLQDAIEFLGSMPRDTLIELYRECSVMVFPSTVETFGLPIIEAMACGAPVACSQSSVMPEVAGDAARFFDPLNPVAIADTISAILVSPELQAELSRRGQERAKRFNWPEAGSQTAEIFLLGGGRRPAPG